MKNSPNNSADKTKQYAIDHQKSYEEMQVQDEHITEHPEASPELKIYLQKFIETKDPLALEKIYDKRFAEFFAKQFSPQEEKLTNEYKNILRKTRKQDPDSRETQRAEGEIREKEMKIDENDDRIYLASMPILSNARLLGHEVAEGKITEEQKEWAIRDIIQKNVKDKSQRERVAIAGYVAYYLGDIPKYIQSFGIISEKNRINIAEISSQRHIITFIKNFKNFEITSEKARLELAKEALSRAGKDFSNNFKNFAITSKKAVLEIASFFVSECRNWKHFENYGITSEDVKKELAELGVAKNTESPRNIQHLNITDEKFKSSLLKKVIFLHGSRDNNAIHESIQDYELSDTTDLAEVFTTALIQNASETVNELSRYFPELTTEVKEDKLEDSDHKFPQDSFFLDRHPSDYLDSRIANIINTIKIKNPWNPNIKGIQNNIQKAHKKFPSLIPDCVAKSIYADMQRMDAGLKLLGGFITRPDDDFSSDPKQNSRQALSNITGFPIEGMQGKEYSSDTMGDFYELVLEIQKKICLTKAFERFDFDASLFPKKKFSQILHFLSALHNLVQLFNEKDEQQAMYNSLINTCAIWADQSENPIIFETREQLQEHAKNMGEGASLTKLKITPENIGVITSNLKESFNAWFADVVQLEKGQKIRPEDMDQLMEKWGDVLPFTILAARYHGGDQEWQEELPILSKITKYVLAEKFHEYKYHGDPEDEYDIELAGEQTEMFSEKQLEKWKENPSSLSLFSESSDEGLTDKELLEKSHDIFKRNVLHHLPANLDKDKKYLLTVKELLENKGKDLIKLIKQYTENQPKKILYHCLSLLKVETSIDVLKKLISKLLSVGDVIGLTKQLKDDLKSMAQVLTPQKSKGDTIIFTTIFDDPKLLLTIGDLVDTSSCQNYKTGEMIETLPGYVIDANVKGIASFAVRPSRNLPKQDFDLIAEALKENSNDVSYEFDAPKKILQISFQDKSYDIPFEYAYHRQVIKAGSTDDEKLGMLMEPPYEQTHPASNYMAQDVTNLFENFAENIGAVTDETILCPETRNYGGIYSDIAGGTQTEEYRIKPEKQNYNTSIVNDLGLAA